MLNKNDTASVYSLRTSSGASNVVGRRATGLVVESIDRKTHLVLPTLIECNELPNNRLEIPTPDVALYHAHLKI